MKILDRFALKIFSIIIIILAVCVCLVLMGVIDAAFIANQVKLLSDSGDMAIKITIGVIAVLLLLALKGLFFTSKPEKPGKEGIVLENANGKLVISKESLENLVASVIKEIPGADSSSSRTYLDKDKNLVVYVTVIVSKDIMIKDVSNEIQEKIKEAMKRTADLDVKEVNIRIKNITSKKVKGLPVANEATPETLNEAQETIEEVEEKLDNENSENEEE